ncbi:hypothetical protein RND71_003036 [Anisodus tanguticus]|uniref:Uncharacterized protein n=1 Tax=Anisodus tanguticus TaxID=243964 RepID=A0AAE1SV82_9SOLA|nr:hypothetical protein RND71_003036 [Anisodus tanguticus]
MGVATLDEFLHCTAALGYGRRDARRALALSRFNFRLRGTPRRRRKTNSICEVRLRDSSKLNLYVVQVIWATDHASQWKEGVMRKDELSTSAVASKIVRVEVSLSRHRRSNRLGSATVNLRDEDNENAGGKCQQRTTLNKLAQYIFRILPCKGDVEEPAFAVMAFSLYIIKGRCVTMTKVVITIISQMFVNDVFVSRFVLVLYGPLPANFLLCS